MIQSITKILFGLLVSVTYARGEFIPSEYHIVVSEVYSDELPNGKCLLKGHVNDPFSEQPVQGGVVSNFARTSYDVTDSTGYYEFEINANDTSIFFYHEKYNEIIVWSIRFKEKHITTIDFYSSERLADGVIQVAEKPVIYLYPETKTEVSLQLQTDIELSFTYPAYNNGWNVTADSDGTISIGEQEYPYLFWEGNSKDLSFNQTTESFEGFFIKTDTAISFLENTLYDMGLNSNEATDFITYWGPRLTASNYATIQFFVDESYSNNIAGINVEPKPDVSRRVYMIFSLSELEIAPENLSSPTYDPITREGFVLIEWGGTEIKSPQHF